MEDAPSVYSGGPIMLGSSNQPIPNNNNIFPSPFSPPSAFSPFSSSSSFSSSFPPTSIPPYYPPANTFQQQQSILSPSDDSMMD